MSTTKIVSAQILPDGMTGYAPYNNAGAFAYQDPGVTLQRIAVSLAGDVITSGGQVVYSSL